MNIDWKEIGEEDYISYQDGFVFRLEAMDRNLWWFQVYKNSEVLFIENNFTFTKEEAERRIMSKLKELNSN